MLKLLFDIQSSVTHIIGLNTSKSLLHTLFLTLFACGFLLVAGSGPALAQSSSEYAGTLEEIVVTSQRREQSLQDTPVAVTALTSVELQNRGLINTFDLANAVPNVTSMTSLGGGSSHGQYFIRGLGLFDFIMTSEQAVGFYLDGVYIARSTGAALDLVDVERIEVLKGPQGTLFGRNTTAGAIQVITKNPAREFEANAEVTVGERDRIDVKGNVSVPLIQDQLFLKLAAATLNQDGWGKRLLTGEESSDRNRDVFRGQLQWEPSDDLNFRFIGDYTRTRQKGNTEQLLNVVQTPPGGFALSDLYQVLFLAPQGLPPIDSFVATDPDESYANEANIDRNDIYGFSLTASWEINDHITAKSITAYRNTESHTGWDLDGTPYPEIEQEIQIDHEQISQELQLSGRAFNNRLNWIAGFFYFHEQGTDLEDIPFLQAIAATGMARVGRGFKEYVEVGPPLFIFIGTDTKSYAGYGQGTYSLTEKLAVTAGVRYTYEKKFDDNYLAGALVRPFNTLQDDWNNTSPKFGIEYRQHDDLMLYASVSRGFRSGVFNGRALDPVVPPAADPETIWAYEAGVKSEWFDNRLRANLAGFFYDYNDLQGFTLEAGATILGNIATVELWGFEAEFLARPVENLELQLGIGHTAQDITEVAPGAAISITPDTRIPGSPEWNVVASGQYTVPVGEWGNLAFRADYSHKSSYEFLLPNTPLEGENGYELLNLGVSFTPLNERWSLRFFVDNVTDERYRAMAEDVSLFSINTVVGAFSDPREWGLTLRVHY